MIKFRLWSVASSKRAPSSILNIRWDSIQTRSYQIFTKTTRGFLWLNIEYLSYTPYNTFEMEDKSVSEKKAVRGTNTRGIRKKDWTSQRN